jgi:hypothetical protein
MYPAHQRAAPSFPPVPVSKANSIAEDIVRGTLPSSCQWQYGADAPPGRGRRGGVPLPAASVAQLTMRQQPERDIESNARLPVHRPQQQHIDSTSGRSSDGSGQHPRMPAAEASVRATEQAPHRLAAPIERLKTLQSLRRQTGSREGSGTPPPSLTSSHIAPSKDRSDQWHLPPSQSDKTAMYSREAWQESNGHGAPGLGSRADTQFPGAAKLRQAGEQASADQRAKVHREGHAAALGNSHAEQQRHIGHEKRRQGKQALGQERGERVLQQKGEPAIEAGSTPRFSALDEVPAVAQRAGVDFKAMVSEQLEAGEAAGAAALATRRCPTCSRTFNDAAYKKHAGICKKVFVHKRAAFNVKASRAAEGAAELSEGAGGGSVGRAGRGARKSKGPPQPLRHEDQPALAAGARKSQAGWRQKSALLQAAMKTTGRALTLHVLTSLSLGVSVLLVPSS